MKPQGLALVMVLSTGCFTATVDDGAPTADGAGSSEPLPMPPAPDHAATAPPARSASGLAIPVGPDRVGLYRDDPNEKWFTITTPEGADGMLHLGFAENPDAPKPNGFIRVHDASRRPIDDGSKKWHSLGVSGGREYLVSARLDSDARDAAIAFMFEPVIDAYEPNDDLRAAAHLASGERIDVRMFAPRERNAGVDADFFHVTTNEKHWVRVQLHNPSRVQSFCVDVVADAVAHVGTSCSDTDIDAAFLLPVLTEDVFVKLTGTTGPYVSQMTISML